MTSSHKAEIDLEVGILRQRPGHSSKQVAYLDGLRGVAAFIVYWSHNVSWWYGPESVIENGFGYHDEYMLATAPFIRTLFSGGAAAVAVFFVMSGYVLSNTPFLLLKAGDMQKLQSYLLTAILRRPFRLFLPVAAMSLIFACCMHLPFGLAPKLSWPEAQESLIAELWKWLHEFGWAMNIFARHGTFTPWFPYNPPIWTMAAELKGSLAVYAFFLVMSVRKSERHFSYSMALSLILLLLHQWDVSAFMFGIAMAASDAGLGGVVLSLTPFVRSCLDHGLFLLSWLLLGQPHGRREPEIALATPGWYFLTKLTPPSYFHDEFWRFWNVIAASLLICAVRNISWIQLLLQRPALRYLGTISFCLYLIHMPVLWTISDRVARVLGVSRFDFTTLYDRVLPVPDLGPKGFSTGFLLWQAIVLPINLFVATQATKFIDQPSIRFSKWLAT